MKVTAPKLTECCTACQIKNLPRGIYARGDSIYIKFEEKGSEASRLIGVSGPDDEIQYFENEWAPEGLTPAPTGYKISITQD